MTNSFENNGIDQARSRLHSLIIKDEEFQRSCGNLDVNGELLLTEDKTRRQSVEPDSASAAKTSLSGGPQMTGTVNLNLPGNDSNITGNVGGKEKARPNQELWEDKDSAKKKQEAILRPTKLSLPMARAKRPTNADGATSFHFAHEAISKTPIERTSERGTKNRKGSASDHARYIERDEALAKTEESQLSKIEGDLRDLLKIEPGLARRLGLDPDTADKDIADGKLDKSPTEKALGVGVLAAIYIEREAALAHNDSGVAVLFTNISSDAEERREFWKLVEEHESDPSVDVMRLNIGSNKKFWDKIRDDEHCPKVLRLALKAAEPKEEIKVHTGDNQEIRRLMKKHGWRPPEKRHQGETDQQRDEREEREAKSAHGAKFEDGRGGRVQYRIVGELPYDVDPDARIRILKGFSDEFEKRNLPFIAVMHAPDHTNDDRNWHFHLVYHDRPARRFTGKTKDHLWNLPEDAPKQVADRHKITKQALEENNEAYIGKWDFTVPHAYLQKCRHKKTTYPFAQNKDREVTRRPFLPHLRRLLADLTNTELERARKDRRLDPRKYSEMGIHKQTEVHLGTTNSRLETLGIPTEPGIANEAKQWEYIKESIQEHTKKQKQALYRKVTDWNSGLNASEISGADRARAEFAMFRWEQRSRTAIEHDRISKTLEEHISRMRSRASKVEATANNHLEAIKANLATQRQVGHLSEYTAKLQEAQAHLIGLEIHISDEIDQVAISRAAATEKHAEAKAYADIVDKIIDAGKQKRRDSENVSAGLELTPVTSSQRHR